jgi:hypothetical protein
LEAVGLERLVGASTFTGGSGLACCASATPADATTISPATAETFLPEYRSRPASPRLLAAGDRNDRGAIARPISTRPIYSKCFFDRSLRLQRTASSLLSGGKRWVNAAATPRMLEYFQIGAISKSRVQNITLYNYSNSRL